METIYDLPERPETFVAESRDDNSVSTLLEEDLIVAHPSADPDDEQREEAIEIINISFLHE